MTPITPVDIELRDISPANHDTNLPKLETYQQQHSDKPFSGNIPTTNSTHSFQIPETDSKMTTVSTTAPSGLSKADQLEGKQWYRLAVLAHSLITHTPQPRSRYIVSEFIQRRLQPDHDVKCGNRGELESELDRQRGEIDPRGGSMGSVGGTEPKLLSYAPASPEINRQNLRVGVFSRKQRLRTDKPMMNIKNLPVNHNYDPFDDNRVNLSISLVLACVAVFILPLYEGRFVYYSRWGLIIMSSYFGPQNTNGFYSILGILILGLMINRPLTVCTICLGAWSWVILIGIVTDAMGIKYYK